MKIIVNQNTKVNQTNSNLKPISANSNVRQLRSTLRSERKSKPQESLCESMEPCEEAANMNQSDVRVLTSILNQLIEKAQVQVGSTNMPRHPMPKVQVDETAHDSPDESDVSYLESNSQSFRSSNTLVNSLSTETLKAPSYRLTTFAPLQAESDDFLPSVDSTDDGNDSSQMKHISSHVIPMELANELMAATTRTHKNCVKSVCLPCEFLTRISSQAYCN
jgi:hypothetical protein